MAFNMNTDYQKLINEAKAKGDTKAAAAAEASRNEKIAAMNSAGTNTNNYTTTNNYTKPSNPAPAASPDLGQQLTALLGNNGGNYNKDLVGQIQSLYDQRTAKAMGSPNLNQFANDNIMLAARSYLDSAKNYQTTQEMLAAMEEMRNQQFVNPQAGNIESLLNGLLNKPKFEYDYKKDPAWQAYATKFGMLGDEAMADTLGEVSSATGGMPSSYAITAAAQQKNRYNQQITDIIPTLMQAAYDRYQAGIDTDMNLLGTVNDLGNTAYNQFSDQQNRSMDAASWLAENAYNASRDSVADDQYNREFEYTVSRDKVLDAQWLKNYESDERQRIVQNAIDRRQISVSEGNLALNRAEFEYKKNNTETDLGTDYYPEMLSEANANGGWDYVQKNASQYTKAEYDWLEEKLKPKDSTNTGWGNSW